MEQIYYFFRSKPCNNNNFIMFGNIHLIIFLFAISISILILKYKSENRFLELFIATILILQQIILYTWYFSNNYKILKEGLPLYHCRLSIIFVGFGLLLQQEMLIKFGSYWGIFGSIGALLFPGLDPFLFPHITQFSYFIGHLFLLWGCVYILFVKKVGMNKIDFKNTLIFTNIYHMIMFFMNHFLGSNYAYMNKPPINIGYDLNTFLYVSIAVILFNIVLFIEYILLNKYKLFGYKFNIENVPEDQLSLNIE